MSVAASALYGAILVIFTVVLAINVSRNRLKIQSIADGDTSPGAVNAKATLHRAVRAHGNAAEHVPLGVLMLVIAELMGAHHSSMHGLGGTMLVGRLASAHGLLSSTQGSRALGAALTWLAILGAAVYAMMLRFR